MALALDGSVHGNATAGSLAVSLTTSGAGIVCVTVLTNGGPGTSVTASGLTFALRVRANRITVDVQQTEELWWAYSASALSAKSITVNQTSSAYLSVDAFGVSGTFNSSNPFDSNGSLPAKAEPYGTDVLVSTTTANAFIISGYRFLGTSTPTQGSGFTKISGADFQLSQYKIVSATQTNLDLTVGTGAGDTSAGVGDALIESGASPDVTLALTGNAGTSAVGSFGTGSLFTKALTGNAGTGGVGTVTPGLSKALTGNAATASCGTVLPSLTFGLTGSAATGAVGTVSINGNVTLGLTGNQATSFVGTLAPGLSKAVTGNAGTSAVGTFSRASLVTLGLSGNAGTAAVGTVTITGDRTVALTGVSALGAVGSISISGGNVWTPVTPASGTWTPATLNITTWTRQ